MLTPSETARVEAHIAGCAVCRARLADYDTIASALSGERVPSPDAGLWRDLRARLREAPTHRVPTLSHGWLSTIAAAAVVLLLIVGFARLLNGKPSQQVAALTWRSVTLPARAGFYYHHGLGLSASDGETAYTCAAAFDTSGHFTGLGDIATQIFLTRDRGLHWAQQPTLISDDSGAPLTLSAPLAVAGDGALLVTGSPSQGGMTELFRLPTGSTTWQQLTQPQGNPFGDTAAVIAYAPQPGAGILWANDASGHPLVTDYP